MTKEKVRSALIIYGNRWNDWLLDRWEEAPNWMYWGDDGGPWSALACKALDHSPTADQCGIPAHDFCYTCGKAMPNMAKERQR